MTPAELLAPQPPTVPGEDQRPVWGLIAADMMGGRYGRQPVNDSTYGLLVDLFHARDAQGATKYGHRLRVDSGRNSRVDELQEALDGMAYSRQTREQEERRFLDAQDAKDWVLASHHAAKLERAHVRHLRCLQTVLELLEELS